MNVIWQMLPPSLLLLSVVVFAISCHFSAVEVNAFSLISVRALRHNAALNNFPRSTYRKIRNKSQLWAIRRQVTIRDWRTDDNEPDKIFTFLLRQQKEQERTSKDAFDPEGSLELDVLNQLSLQESYAKEDGGCFLVAATGDGGDDDKDENNNLTIVGTLGMIAGTKVTYQSSGSSMSEPEVTAAIRRVCACWPDDCDDDDETSNQSLTTRVSSTSILKDLIRLGEERALQAGATNLIGLAYPEKAAPDDNAYSDDGRIFVKPSVDVFESLGYRASEQQIPGIKTIQFEKKLSRKTNNKADVMEFNAERWIIPAAVASLLLVGFIVYNLYSNVFGIEQLWGSSDNAGIGTSLSSQNLEELIRDEQLGRSGLDEGISPGVTRRWEDLSPEELREEQALMKVIQGQSIRLK